MCRRILSIVPSNYRPRRALPLVSKYAKELTVLGRRRFRYFENGRFSSCVRLRETDFFNPRGNRMFYLVENVGE